MRIVQLTDTHFIEDGREAEGGRGYNTDEAFADVAQHLSQAEPAELIVATGDITDFGTAADYVKAADALSSLNAPVNACPGNHDQDLAFSIGLARPTLSTSRALRLENWLFLFADSNRGHMVAQDSGRLVDPESYGDRLHKNGRLGEREQAWLVDACAATDAEHVFIWVHHPPLIGLAPTHDQVYDDEWLTILPRLANLRGIGAGHTHVPSQHIVNGGSGHEALPVFVGPALKSNFDLGAATLLPPGYRSYEFSADGTVTSESVLMDGDRWPRTPLPDAVVAFFQGTKTSDP